jgi:xylulokinase
MNDRYVIGHDAGTGGDKAILAKTTGEVVAREFEPYSISHPAQGCAEQDPVEWWSGVAATTSRLVSKTGIDPKDVAGIGFSSQMLGVLPMTREGEPLCPGIIWMDCRAEDQARRVVRRLGGEWVLIRIAGAVPSGKDVLCKIKWIEENQPEVFNRTHVFLDVKGYLVYRATGRFVTDPSAASVTGVMDKKTRGWSGLMAKLTGMPLDKMPEIAGSLEVVGELKNDAAGEMGLPEGTPVIGGMGDAPSGPVGAGALEHGEGVISVGTSGLLLITIAKPVNLGRFGMASVAAADPKMWLLTGEMNTAGESLDWFAEELAGREEHERAAGEGGLMGVLNDIVKDVPPGARGIIFAPWMYGERAPVTDTALRGAFINISIDSTRKDMLRSLYEGVALNFRWMLEAAESKGLPCETVRAIGGGALSDPWMQIFADSTGRRFEAIENPQEAGAIGAALAVPVALGIYGDYRDIKQVVRVRKTFEPDANNKKTYDRLFGYFKEMHHRLSPLYKSMNSGG